MLSHACPACLILCVLDRFVCCDVTRTYLPSSRNFTFFYSSTLLHCFFFFSFYFQSTLLFHPNQILMNASNCNRARMAPVVSTTTMIIDAVAFPALPVKIAKMTLTSVPTVHVRTKAIVSTRSMVFTATVPKTIMAHYVRARSMYRQPICAHRAPATTAAHASHRRIGIPASARSALPATIARSTSTTARRARAARDHDASTRSVHSVVFVHQIDLENDVKFVSRFISLSLIRS